MSEDEKKAIALLKEDIKSYQKEVETSKYKKDVKSFSKYVERYTTILNLIEKQAKEIEEFQLIKEVLESYGKNGVGEYSKRYLTEYQATHHTPFYPFVPDPDEIYKKYYEQKEEIEKLQKERGIYYYEWKTLEADLINNDIIPKSKIREKIKEVENNKENYIFKNLTSEDIRRTIITNYKKLLEEK